MTETFRRLIAWQQGKALAREIYEVTRLFPDAERFGLVSQRAGRRFPFPATLRKAGDGEPRRTSHTFLLQARGSLYEVETQIELANELHYTKDPDAGRLLKACNELSRVLNSLISSIT